MARIEPNMLCLVKKDGECKGMVRTIRRQNETDILPASTDIGWLCEALGAMQAQRLVSIGGHAINLGDASMPAGSEGWVSESYLYPLPGLDDESERDTETPKIEEKEHDLVL